MDNKDKCNKYESYFVFRSEEEFNSHLNECSDCREEHEKMLKISNLMKEVAPVYLKREEKKKTSTLKRIACCFVLLIGITSYTGYNMYNDYNFEVNTADESYIESTMGLPIDEYGFLEI